jgi:hypothetical protein
MDTPLSRNPGGERDTATLEQPYAFSHLTDSAFHKELTSFVGIAKAQYDDLGLTLYYRILPGLHDAQRRFAEHKGDPAYRLNSCEGLEAYIKSLGLNPASVRKWRQRDKERKAMHAIKSLAGLPPKPKREAVSAPERESEARLLAEQCLRMTKTLIGPSVEPLSERIKKVIGMGEAVREASAAGVFGEADFVEQEHAPEPAPAREFVPEPDGGKLDDLVCRINRMADTDDIVAAVTKYVENLLNPLLRPGLVLRYHFHASQAGKSRIDLGDWVERGPEGTKQKSGELGRVVGRDKLGRPKIRWFRDVKWQDPRSMIAAEHVLLAEEAHERYPDAFASYSPGRAEIESTVATLASKVSVPNEGSVEQRRHA